MAYSIGLFLRDTAIRFRQTAMDLAYASLNSYQRTTSGFEVYTSQPSQNSNNPWQMPVGNSQDDITWLLG